MKRFYLIFSGRVQGVGFRSFVQMQILKWPCTGWIRNMSNGNVEMEIQGKESDIEQLLANVYKGNRFVRIDDYSIKEISPLKTERGFQIRG